MNEFSITLSENEEQILQTLWQEGRPLTRGEIVSLTTNKTWKESSIHILLNQLLDKEAIVISDIVQTGKGFGRTYAANIDKDSYDLNKLKNETNVLNPSKNSMINYISFLVKSNKISEDDISELEDIIKSK